MKKAIYFISTTILILCILFLEIDRHGLLQNYYSDPFASLKQEIEFIKFEPRDAEEGNPLIVTETGDIFDLTWSFNCFNIVETKDSISEWAYRLTFYPTVRDDSEHPPIIVLIARDGMSINGINYKAGRIAALGWFYRYFDTMYKHIQER